MVLTQEQSLMLAKLRKKSAGMFSRIQKIEAKARTGLPPKTKGIAKLASATLGTGQTSGDYIMFQMVVLSPEEHHGKLVSKFLNLTESEYRSFEQALGEVVATFKLLGYEDDIENADEEEFFTSVLPNIIEDINNTKQGVRYRTGNRAKDDGTANVFFDDLVAAEDVEQLLHVNGKPEPEEGTEEEPEPEPEKEPEPVKKSPRPKKFKEPEAESAPPRKAPPRKKPKEDVIAVGSNVRTEKTFFDDGQEYFGTVAAISDSTATVEFEGGDSLEIPLDKLVLCKVPF